MKTFWSVLFLALLPTAEAYAQPPNDILESYRVEAKVAATGPGSFSAKRGRDFFLSEHPTARGPISCATCHTPDPRHVGMTRANKAIDPLAPSANAKRFTDRAKVEKWFTRNCDDVLRRPCTALEKGDFITYLLTIK